MMPLPDQSNFCCYCGEKSLFLTKDHLIPKSKGGANNNYNKRNCCKRCNTEKKYLYPHEYLSLIMDRRAFIKNTNLEIKIENIRYVIEYVETAGEKLFISKVDYEYFKQLRQ